MLRTITEKAMITMIAMMKEGKVMGEFKVQKGKSMRHPKYHYTITKLCMLHSDGLVKMLSMKMKT